jgi:predicted dehydrogenase
MKKKISIGIIGLGHWGKNYLRLFSNIRGVQILGLCDINIEKKVDLIKDFKNILITKDYNDLIKNTTIDTLIVATNADSHYEIVKKSLKNNKNILCEKPLTLKTKQALELEKLSRKKKKILMVNHTFLYNPAVNLMRKIIVNGKIGKIYYLKATRTHLGLIREDVNVIWDLIPHDIAIFNYLLNSIPIKISGLASSFLKKNRNDAAFINMKYPKNIISNIHVSWADTNKERKIEIVGSKGRIVFDDLNNLEKVKIFEKGISVSEKYNNFGEFQLNLRDGSIISPNFKMVEPMRVVCNNFIKCLQKKIIPYSNGKFAAEIIRVINKIHNNLI